MQILDGKLVSEAIKEQLKLEVETIIKNGKKTPVLAAVLVGSEGASETYVNHKIKSCKQIGFGSKLVRLNANVTENQLLEEINLLNEDNEIDGIIVQLPLPAHINVQKVIEMTNFKKDVDGFHPVNTGRMLKNLPSFLPATPMGILQLIEHYKIETSAKHCVVLGRSQIVGLPLSVLMGMNTYPGNSTVTLCHSRTKNINEITKRADILICATGIPSMVTSEMVKEGAVVIDVGITRIEDKTKKSGYRLQGDVDYHNVAPKTSYITPVPGGVGPMTIAALLINTLKAAKNEIYPA